MSADPDKMPEGLRLTEAEKLRQSKRNRAIGYAIAGLCVVFYLITVFKMGPSILNRSM
jgi:hypothetical protein